MTTQACFPRILSFRRASKPTWGLGSVLTLFGHGSASFKKASPDSSRSSCNSSSRFVLPSFFGFTVCIKRVVNRSKHVWWETIRHSVSTLYPPCRSCYFCALTFSEALSAPLPSPPRSPSCSKKKCTWYFLIASPGLATSCALQPFKSLPQTWFVYAKAKTEGLRVKCFLFQIDYSDHAAFEKDRLLDSVRCLLLCADALLLGSFTTSTSCSLWAVLYLGFGILQTVEAERFLGRLCRSNDRPPSKECTLCLDIFMELQ